MTLQRCVVCALLGIGFTTYSTGQSNNPHFEQVPGSLAQISVGADGTARRGRNGVGES
jgi:hypothetical protein